MGFKHRFSFMIHNSFSSKLWTLSIQNYMFPSFCSQQSEVTVLFYWNVSTKLGTVVGLA